MKLTLKGNPKSTQHCYKYRRAGNFIQGYMDKKCVELKASYAAQARKQWTRKPFTENVSVSLTLYMGTRHRADIDNFHKLILDTLSGIVYDDDVQIKELHTFMDYDKSDPRAELEIHPLK